MSSATPTVMFAGGGTGGHLFPALAIADEVRALRPDASVHFVGTSGKIEARVVPQRGYPVHLIWTAGLQRSFQVKNILVPLRLAVSLIQSFFLMRHVRPDVVVGTGGYVCGPVLYAASVMGIPTVLHESNSYPGITTRILAGRVTRLFLGFEDAKRRLKRTDHVEVVGTPTLDLRKAARPDGLAAFGLDEQKNTVLMVGGSLGSVSLNEALLTMMDLFQNSENQLIWQTGPQHFEPIAQRLGDRKVGWVGPFIERMDLAYAAADMVICRAGASTIAELTRVGKPAILVPYPHAAADHQTHNARTLVDAGAAEMIADGDIRGKLKDALLNLINNKARREAMTAASRRLGAPDAAKRIAEYVVRIAQQFSIHG